MRDKLNNNPMAQVGIVAVLILAVAVVALKMMKKDEPAPAPTVADGTVVAGTPPAPAAGDPSLSAATTGVPTAAFSGLPVVPGPPLPKAVKSAFNADRVVVLLVVRGGGDDDRLLRQSAAGVAGESRVAFFSTRAKGVARYARITQGVDLNRVPALVVVHPAKRSNGPASAEVSYGYRSSESVVQAVRDALYKGPKVSYAPD
jgi:hypothetical protein